MIGGFAPGTADCHYFFGTERESRLEWLQRKKGEQIETEIGYGNSLMNRTALRLLGIHFGSLRILRETSECPSVVLHAKEFRFGYCLLLIPKGSLIRYTF